MSFPPDKPQKNCGGTYKLVDGKLVKISDQTHTFYDAYVPEGGYVDETLGHSVEDRFGNSHWVPARVSSRTQKAHLMKKANVVEVDGFKPRIKRQYFDLGR